ncbi:hypothetical protein ACFQ60_00505 [Streptomyces zhihengii]
MAIWQAGSRLRHSEIREHARSGLGRPGAPQHGSVRGRRYTKRRQRLLDLVGGLGPRSRRCRRWSGTRPSRHRGSRASWRSGPAGRTGAVRASGARSGTRRPRTWSSATPVRGPGRGRWPYAARTARHPLPAPHRPARRRRALPPARRRRIPGRTHDGQTYTSTPVGFLVEALSGTTRHAVVTITRVR